MSWPTTVRVLVLCTGLCVTLLAACGASSGSGPNNKDVGGRCSTDNDCSKRCLTGGNFPGGYCTITCATDADCPSEASCVSTNGGICMVRCQVPDDCNGFGVGYQCNRLARQQGGEGALVCTGG